jgi:hypothetical protein
MIATLAFVILSTAALVVSVVDRLSDTAAAEASPLPAADRTAGARAKAKCAACGFVQSVRRVAAHGDAPETYEITVRLRDGSTHVHSDAAGANWRRGERIVFIAGERVESRKPVGELIGR